MLAASKWSRVPVLAALMLLIVGGSGAHAQLANTAGPNPQVLGDDGGTGYDHGYAVPPPPLASLGGSFELTDQSGRTVTEATFRGKWMLVYFGYAGCAEACPIALQTMAATLDILGADAEQVQPAFVDFSVVYARMHHKPAAHAPKIDPVSFATAIHPRLLLLTGTRRAVYGILRSYKVRQEHSPLAYGNKEAGMRIDHTTRIYLVGPDGKMAGYYYHSIAPGDLALELLLKLRS